MTEINKEKIEAMIHDRQSRTAVTTESHIWFFSVYFGHYMTYPFADFHYEMFNLTEDENINTALVMAFRGSAKSTIFTTSYPIWSILGKPQKKFVIILGQTQRQARQHLINIRKELEGNELLRSDLGPFKEIEDEWGSMSLVIPKYDARITAASMEQTIRGMKHKQYRPDLIICDDIEDLQSVKTKEGRDKIHNWISGEVIPAGDKNTKIIFVGNLLHEDSLLMRIKEKIDVGIMNGKTLLVPLLDNDNQIAWPGKFKNISEVEIERKKIANDQSWAREYLLKILSGNDRVVHPEWIKFYDDLPKCTIEGGYRCAVTGIDLAISKADSADYTALVSALVFGYEDKLKIYILPNPINKRISFQETTEISKTLIKSLEISEEPSWLLVEDVGYQRALVEQFDPFEYRVRAMKVLGDKKSRLAIAGAQVQNCTVVFPRKGAEELISQIVNFGAEKHDDLADAFSLMINSIITRLPRVRPSFGIWFICNDGKMDGANYPLRDRGFDEEPKKK